MKWEFAHAASIGGREVQQDRVAGWHDPAAGAVFAALADGLGGHKGGEIAAQAVIDVAGERWQSTAHPIAAPEEFLRDLCYAAHQRIGELAASTGQRTMSTCALLYADAAQAAWLHVGDSRIYQFRGCKTVHRSRDHSAVQVLLDSGELQEAEAVNHPDQNILLQSLGGERDPKPTLGSTVPKAGDSFLVCSDGVWGALSSDEMAQVVARDPLPQAASSMVDTAVRRSGAEGDNASVVVLRADGNGPGGALGRRSRVAAVTVLAGAVLLAAAYALLEWREHSLTLEARKPPPAKPVETPSAKPVEIPPVKRAATLPTKPVQTPPAKSTETLPARPAGTPSAKPAETLPARPVEMPPANPVEVEIAPGKGS